MCQTINFTTDNKVFFFKVGGNGKGSQSISQWVSFNWKLQKHHVLFNYAVFSISILSSRPCHFLIFMCLHSVFCRSLQRSEKRKHHQKKKKALLILPVTEMLKLKGFLSFIPSLYFFSNYFKILKLSPKTYLHITFKSSSILSHQAWL